MKIGKTFLRSQSGRVTLCHNMPQLIHDLLIHGVLVFVLVLVASPAFAQAAYYQFSQSTGALDPQPGTGVTALVGAASADGVSAVNNIGFSLNYAGVTYTQFSASANGLLRLGSTAVTAESVNNITSVTNFPKIMGFWDDMATGTSASGAGVRTWLSGTAPNRKRVIDFKLASNDLTTSAYDFQFQIWIHETSGTIEMLYGAGAGSGKSASIGLGGVSATEFLSITPGGPATTSSLVANNTIAANPGAGTKYTFAPPAPLTGLKTVGTGMDYPSLKDAVAVLNWVGVGTGGVTFSILGGHTETVASGSTTPNPDVPAGLFITATGTASNPIVIQWNGSGAKPVFKAGAGIGNFDFVIGIGGGSYITLDGLNIQEDNTNNTTDAKRAEIGIGLFKKQYNTSLGNIGCSNITVKNCMITLTRDPNAYGNYAYCQDQYFSAGIKASAFTYTHQGATNFFEGGNPNGGIKSQNDVHRNCVIIGNTIDNCSFGIVFADRWAESGGNVFAGSGNIIGQTGAGNTITNWGLKPGTTELYSNTDSDMGRVIAGIAIGAQKDYTIEYNTISTCGTSSISQANGPQSYCGILAGTGADGNSWPQHAAGFFAKINHNAVSGIDLTTGTVDNTKGAYGISFSQFSDDVTNVGLSSKYANGNVEIKYNTITGLTTKRGDCHGISCKYYYEAWKRYFTYNDRTGGFQTNGNIDISNNIIKGLTFLTNASNDYDVHGVLSAIYWMHGQNTLYIQNNTIGGAGADGLVRGATSKAYIARQRSGTRIIYANAFYNNKVTRNLVLIKNNSITNADVLTSASTPAADDWGVGFSAIFIDNGALTNEVDGNTITECNVANGARAAESESQLAFIYVKGRPKSGVSTVKIHDNTIQNNTRTGYRYYATNYSANAHTTCILANYDASGQVKNIYNNLIDNITGVAINSTNSHLYYASITGIRARGNSSVNTSVYNIYGNTIKNLGGDTYSYAQTYSNASDVNYSYGFNTIGINVTRYHRLYIHGNSICNLSTTSTGFTSDQNYMNGVVGIMYGNDIGEVAPFSSQADPKVAVYNNFIGQLTAPAMRGRTAIVGAYQWGTNRFKVFAHNTIVLGGLTGTATGRLSSTTTGAFGVSGFINYDYWRDNKTYKTGFVNNVISINADCKGTGMGTAWRHIELSGVKKAWRGIGTYSSGNVYYVNDDANNYIYGQGQNFNTSGGVRNCYGYGSSVTTNPTHNLVNDNALPNNFNQLCGKYKSFMGGREKGSFIDLDMANNMLALPFTGTGGCADEMKISNAANSYVYRGVRLSAPKYYNIDTDFYGAARGTSNVTAGAHENNGNISGPVVQLINFEYDPICDGVCTGSKTITATITPPTGKTIATATGKTPRLYFRRIQNASAISAAQSDNNVMVSAVNNTAAGTEGWRWVEASSVSGNDYTFTVNEALLRNTIVTTPTYTIEYFLIAETSDGTVCNWSSGDLSANCPATVDLFSIAGAATVPADDDGDTAMDENSVDDRYTVYTGSSITKELEFVNNGITYTSNLTTPLAVCTGDEIKLNGLFTVAGEEFNEGCVEYKLEVADNNTFSTGLQSFTQSSPDFSYIMAAAGTKYFRIWLHCGGTNVTNANTVYVSATASNMPVNTTVADDLNSCVGVSQNVTVSSSTPTVAKYYWVANKHGKLYSNSPTSTTATSQVRAVNPADTSEAGTWHTYVTLATGASLTDLGVKAADHYDGSAYVVNGGDVDTTKGMAFHTNSMIKLNSISVLDDPSDGVGTAGFKLSLYSKTGVLLYSTAAQSTTDGQLKQIALTNWYIPPGDYMIVMGASTAGVEPTGGLAIVGASLPIGIPNTSTSGLDILGGINDLNFESLDNSANNYFFDWDVTILCTSNDVPFEYMVNPASCCAMPAPDVALISNNTFASNLEYSKCTNITGNWIYYFDPADPSKLLCAVDPNGNPWNPSAVNLFNTGTSSDTAHLRTDGSGSASELMPYILQLENADVLTVNGGVKIRFFYPAAQKTIIDAYVSKTWFSYGSDKQGILDVLSPNGLSGKISLTPSATGSENGVPYVEFHNITTFSTSFGFLGTNCSAAGQVTETDLSCTVDDSTIKGGDEATLTASGGAAYLWEDGSTLAIRAVTPLVNTTYTVTITDENGCTDTISTEITVVAGPTAAIVTTDNSCAPNDAKVLSGDAATLTASGGDTYTWDDASTAAVRVVNPLVSTSYTVTVSDANGCTDTISSTVTVVSPPSASIVETDNSCAANDSKVLSGAAATLTASGGGTYLWDDASTSAVRNVNPAISTTYFVTVTDVNGCTIEKLKTVTVITAPTASITETDNSCTNNDGKILSGATATLMASGGTFYLWDNASTSPSRNVNPLTTSTYTVTVTDLNGCMASSSTTVTIVTLPTGTVSSADNSCFANDEIIAVGGSATLTAGGGSSYLWDNASTAAVRVVSPVSTTTFTVTVTDANGCTASANKIITVVSSCGVSVAAKVFLGAVYDETAMLMDDPLRAAGLIPLNQPYGGSEYPDFNYTGTETTTNLVLNTTNHNAIVDWVLLEIRDSLNPVTILARRAALLQRDGDIVDVDGSSPLFFTSIAEGNYYVAVRHRNHLGVMTQNAVALSLSGPNIDFTLATTPNYQLSGVLGSPHAQRDRSGNKRSLWPGNTGSASNTGDVVIYQGPSSDVDETYFRVLLDGNNIMFLPNYIVPTRYERTDANMDGMIIYQGSNSDPDMAFFTVLLHPVNLSSLLNHKVYEQIPK